MEFWKASPWGLPKQAMGKGWAEQEGPQEGEWEPVARENTASSTNAVWPV